MCGKPPTRCSKVLLVMFLWLCRSITIANGLEPSAEEDDIRCKQQERNALLTFKESLVDSSGLLSSWGGEDCCLWHGVRCSNKTGHVIRLDLHNNLISNSPYEDYRLRGKINPSLLQLQHLRYLDLSENDFVGTRFPNIHGSLSKLRHLDVNRNYGLDSRIFLVLNLSSLRYLDLSFNFLDGFEDWPRVLAEFSFLRNLKLTGCHLPRIVSMPSIGNSTSLPVSIDLSGNNLSSSVYPLLLNISHRIVELKLGDTVLEGSIPEFFKNMASLKHLDLAHNQLEGKIPEFFKNMVSLKHLDLAHNQLEGMIPEFLGNFCTLKTLNLSNNNLSGFGSVGSSECLLNSLEILRLSRNRFRNSSVLSYATRFSSLRELDLSDNGLNGSFPISFKQPSKLTSLHLEYNQLTGPLPDLTEFSSLELLSIHHNRFNGTLTESLGSLSKLKVLSASWNSLEGLISEPHFENLSKLEILDLSYNLLAFNVSSTWIPPFQLVYILLSLCKLGPQFPKWLQTQKNVQDLDISGAGISGIIPSWFWKASPYINSLNLSQNQMTGKLPADFSPLKFLQLTGIDLSSNLFEGPLPVFPNTLTSLILAKNRFSGSVSPLCNMTSEDLTILDLSDNLLHGELPDCLFNRKYLIVLDFANNNFSGRIPKTVGSLLYVETFNLRNNSFSGDLPSSLKNCSDLEFLDLSQNMFSGTIPAWIGKSLSSLIFLSLQANEFHGKMPSSLCQLANIRILDLSQNSLSGAIPFCLDNLTAMVEKGDPNDIIQYTYLSSRIGTEGSGVTYIQKAMVQWKGKEYRYEKSLGLFRIIDLAGNNFVGEIPEQITKLSELIVLNLSGNSLMGSIPGKIGELKQLQSLDLSRNRLSGRIPSRMADLTFLSYLNLSYNNLSGKIPPGTQLLTLDASAFVGNPALCGPPIATQCSTNDSLPPQPLDDGDKNEERRDEFNKWLYAGMGIGFFIAFSGVSGTLLIKTSWRIAYFRLLDKWWDSLYVTFILWASRLERKFRS